MWSLELTLAEPIDCASNASTAVGMLLTTAMDISSSPCGNNNQSSVKSRSILDHEGNDVNLVWHPTQDRKYSGDQPPPFPFQVYFTKAALKSARDLNFATSLVCLVEEQGGLSQRDPPLHVRFEFYDRPFSSILACVAHQRREVLHRNRNGTYPRMLSKWCQDGDENVHEGRIIVIDRDDCLSTGPIMVVYDPEPINVVGGRSVGIAQMMFLSCRHSA